MDTEGTFRTQAAVRVPKGIRIGGQAESAGPKEEAYPERRSARDGGASPQPWCYLFVRHNKARAFTERLVRDRMVHFVHKTVVYRRRRHTRGIQCEERPTVSGLVFLQGDPRELQDYLDATFGGMRLADDCGTHATAVIPDRTMRPFMRVSEVSPERVRFLLKPFRHYAGGNVRLRLTSGLLAGLEGYVVRIDRDRRLVMDVGGMGVAISGIHCETFEVVEEGAAGSTVACPHDAQGYT